ncbi:hypothetical protein ACS0TY_010521 [Phlomoides rotata]
MNMGREDVKVSVELSFMEAVQGCAKMFIILTGLTCETCEVVDAGALWGRVESSPEQGKIPSRNRKKIIKIFFLIGMYTVLCFPLKFLLRNQYLVNSNLPSEVEFEVWSHQETI